jgi:SAM-dependent methyltransferase
VGYLAEIFAATEEENRRVILEMAEPLTGGRLLDLGCWDGSFTIRVARHVRAGEIHGVELIEEAAASARAAGVEAVTGDLRERLPYADASFDVIHSNQVIEHLPGTDNFMREIRRLLRPGGYALVSTNNLSSWHNILSLVLGYQPPPCHVSDEVLTGNPINFADGNPGAAGQMHLRIFTSRALAHLARFHGLDIDVARTAGYYPLPPWLARHAAQLDPRHGAFLVQRYRVTNAHV